MRNDRVNLKKEYEDLVLKPEGDVVELKTGKTFHRVSIGREANNLMCKLESEEGILLYLKVLIWKELSTTYVKDSGPISLVTILEKLLVEVLRSKVEEVLNR